MLHWHICLWYLTMHYHLLPTKNNFTSIKGTKKAFSLHNYMCWLGEAWIWGQFTFRSIASHHLLQDLSFSNQKIKGPSAQSHKIIVFSMISIIIWTRPTHSYVLINIPNWYYQYPWYHDVNCLKKKNRKLLPFLIIIRLLLSNNNLLKPVVEM